MQSATIPANQAARLAALREHGASRIIIKPFRARAVIDVIADLGKAARVPMA